MRNWLWVALAIAAVVVCCLCVSCPKGGHKSYGGSSSSPGGEGESTRGGSLFGGGVPSGYGPHVDIGQGWDAGMEGKFRPGFVNPLDASGFSWGWSCSGEEFEQYAVSSTAATLHCLYNLSAAEQQQRGMGIESFRLLRLNFNEESKYWVCSASTEVPMSSDRYEDNGARYRAEFPLGSGNYVLAAGIEKYLLIRR